MGELPIPERMIQDIYIEKSRNDFSCFVRGLVIPSATGPQLYADCIQDFQQETFDTLQPSFEAVRDGNLPAIRRFWIERTKKAGKDSDLAIALLWPMAFPTRPLQCQVCAANNRQARIVEDRAIELLHWNTWLNDFVEIVQGVIRNRLMPKEVWVRIEATGSAGAAQGPTPDILVLNELVHVERWAVMQAHMNNAAGVPRGIVIISTNAGIKGTPADSWRKAALKKESRWSCHLFSKIAPWISKEDVEEAKLQDPIGSEFARLWKGQWISGIGGAVDEAAINKAFCLEGPTPFVEKGWEYIAGLDLGVSHDHSGLVVVGVQKEEQRIKVVYLKAWEPSVPRSEDGKLEVDLMAVEEECVRVSELYKIDWLGYDPAAGGSFMAQRLRTRNVSMREMPFTATSLTLMAVSFVQVMKDGILECYEDEGGRLRRDFGKFQIEHRPPSNYKLIAISDDYGHADVGTALIICLPTAIDYMKGWGKFGKDDVISIVGDVVLDDKEIEDMPDELREIYEMDEGVHDDWDDVD